MIIISETKPDNHSLPFSASKEMVLELEQKVKHQDEALESSKSREGFLQKDLAGLCITSISHKHMSIIAGKNKENNHGLITITFYIQHQQKRCMISN